jgi:hypothetical protein
MKIEDQMKQHELYVHYWLAMATTGATKNREVTDGHGRPYTDEELVQDALNTALHHIHHHRECAEVLAEQSNHNMEHTALNG